MRTVDPSAGANSSVVRVSVLVSFSMNPQERIARRPRLNRGQGHDSMQNMKQLLAAGLLFLIALSVLGQEPQFTLKVETNLVNVPCTVTDRKGRLISNLTKDDFIIEEDGK